MHPNNKPSEDFPQIIPITNKRTKNLAGQRFGRLVALGFVGRDKWNQALWLCQCDCEKFFVTLSTSLVEERTQTCGCSHAEVLKERNTKHGLSNSREYITWRGIKARCENPNEIGYKNYGDRGIKICERWRNGFENFYADMGPKPGPEYSIERINNDGDYEPSNCKWGTRQEQNDNSRHNHRLEFQGENLTMTQWARKIGITVRALSHRINTGWSIEKALTTPSEQHSLEFHGERLTIAEWAKKTGINARTLRYRIERGWDIEKMLSVPIKRHKIR